MMRSITFALAIKAHGVSDFSNKHRIVVNRIHLEPELRRSLNLL